MTFLDFLRTHWLSVFLILIVLLATLYVYTHRALLFRKE